MSSGLYFRAQRDGKWMNIELEYLTIEERTRYLESRDGHWLEAVVHRLCETIVELES